MEADQGKLFIGGISWETNEDRLKEYFGSYGEVVEAMIMKDRSTGRARGFGFVVFADPAVANEVVKEKHIIDGRTVEAKKAVPRDDDHHRPISRNSGSIQGSPILGRTKKIFVGGLPSTVTETDFKTYFEQFGPTTDVVVMYDHNTQKPRGFGFITYDSEDSVDRVLHKTFHELNGKMVEVKRAVPKEASSPSPMRSPLIGYNSIGMGRPGSLLDGFGPGYNLGSLRMDDRYNQLANSRASFSQFGGMNMDLNSGFGAGSNPYFSNNLSRYNTPIGYNNLSSNRSDSLFNLSPRNAWGNGGINNNNNNNSNSNASPSNVGSVSYFGSGSGGFGVFGNNGANWGISPIGGNSSGYSRGGGFGRNSGTGVGAPPSFGGPNGGYEGSFRNLYQSGSLYGDPTWQTGSEIDNSRPFGYNLGNTENVGARDSGDYNVGYGIQNREINRGLSD